MPPAGFIVLSTHVLRPRGAKHGAIFAVKVQGYLRAGAIAVQSPNEATFESRCRMLLAGSGAYPGTTCMINFLESRIKTQKL